MADVCQKREPAPGPHHCQALPLRKQLHLQLLSSRQQRSAPLEVTEDARKGSWVSSHFSSRKYSGRFDQPIHRLIREDGIIPNQLRLTPSQRAEYFLNSLEGATWESHPD